MEHPLSKFKFCPICGSTHFEINNFKSKKCGSCGFTYYANPSSATVAFIMNEKDELLVVRRKNEPAKGTLDLPGGFVDMEETGEEGVMREVMEDRTGGYIHSLPVQYPQPLSLFRAHHPHTRYVLYSRSERPLTCRGKRRRCRIPVDSSEQDTDRGVWSAFHPSGAQPVSKKVLKRKS